MAVRPLRFSFVNFFSNPDNARKTLPHRKEVDNDVGLWRNAEFGTKLELTPLSQPQRSADSSVRLSATWPAWLTRENSILLCILTVTGLLYLRCLADDFVLDDIVMFVRNPDLHSWSFLWKAFTRDEFWYTDAGFVKAYHFRNYRPLLLVWYWTNYHLFGLNPALWHASIVAAYLVLVWLVFKVSLRLAGDSTSALMATAVFALFPIHTPAVVWIAANGMVISTALTLAALYIIMPPAKGSWRNWAAAMALYAGALLSHESVTAFPALVACYAFLFYPSTLWMRARRAVIWQAPFAIELLIYMIVRRLVLGFFVSNPYYYINLLTDAQAVLTVPKVLGTYLALLVTPWRIVANRHLLPVSSASSPEFWVPLAAIALVLAVFFVLELRDPRRRLHLFCASWMAVTFAPMIMLHSMPHLLQDYYLCLPSVGWCFLLGDLIAVAARQNAFARRVVFGIVSVMFVVYAVALWRAEWFWHDDVTIDLAYVAGDPDSVSWHWTLASHLDQQGDSQHAEQEIRTALSLEPDRTGTMHPHANQLHHYLAEFLARHGDIDGAVLEIGKGMSGTPDSEDEHPARPPLAYNHDGVSLYYQGLNDARAGRTEQAIQELTEGLEMMKKAPVPDYGPMAMLYIKLAELYDSIGNQAQVDAVLKEVDSMTIGELAEGLARAEIRLNHSDQAGAIQILKELSDRYPSNYDVLIRLADLEFNLKQYKEALVYYERAGGGWFGDAPLHLSMAKSLHELGRDHEAFDQCRLAQALAPHDRTITFSCAEIGNH